MRSWIRKLFTRPATRPARKAPRGFRTVLEVLEDRRVLSSIVVTPIGSGFSYPYGVAVDAHGDVFVADTFNNAVKEVLPGGTIKTIGSGFSYPLGVAVDAAGDVFVADTFNNAVKEVLPGGTITPIGSGFSYPYGVAVDAHGDVFVADTFNNAVKEVLPGGTITTIGSGFSYPLGVAVDAAGDVFVADTFNNAVKEVLPGGTITTIGSGFSYPYGVAVDAHGDVFVADTFNNAVKEVLPGGTITTIGSGFSYPFGVAVDAAGDVFVADTDYNRVVELSPQATTTTSVASSLNPSNFGQSVTFTATVTPGTGTFDNGGTVQFAIDGTNYGSPVSLSGGSATISDSALAASGTAYSVTAAYSGDTDFASSTGTLSGGQTVKPATLTITANNDSKTYGTNKTFSGTAFTENGLVTANGDTITGVNETSTGAPASATVGTYNIVPSAATGTGLGNYSIVYVNGTLTVNPATLTITANDLTKTYGDTVTFAGTAFTTTGLVNSDRVTSVTLTSPGAAATATVAGSPYAITPSVAVGTGLDNYSITYHAGSLTVNPASLTIVADNKTMSFGGPVPA